MTDRLGKISRQWSFTNRLTTHTHKHHTLTLILTHSHARTHVSHEDVEEPKTTFPNERGKKSFPRRLKRPPVPEVKIYISQQGSREKETKKREETKKNWVEEGQS